MTRAFDNGQGIQDPRVSRQHLKVMLKQGPAYEPNGVCMVQALGHNPSTIKRGKLASLGLGFHAEPANGFKLRRARRTAPPFFGTRPGCSPSLDFCFLHPTPARALASQAETSRRSTRAT